MSTQPYPAFFSCYNQLDTPFLFVDKQKFINNLTRLRHSVESFGTELRPHFKTVKSLHALPYLLPDKTAPITVSTVKEAELLASEGYSNIIYAVGICENKLPRLRDLIGRGIAVRVLLDSKEQARFLTRFCLLNQCTISALIEIDCDGHRGGLTPDSPDLIEIAQLLHQGTVELEGVLAHAGESYHCYDPVSLRRAADNEVRTTLDAAQRIRSAGISCNMVSIGSTPTAHSYHNLNGITEVRAGAYCFFDLVMAGTGSCKIDDIAASIVTTVIGHNTERGWLLIDAGWMALSADRGTAHQPKDCGFGLVTLSNGELVEHLQVTSVNQEHGIITAMNGCSINFDAFPIGCRLHILPNHACATASMHQHYHVFDTQAQSYDIWTRIQGW
ncbi:Metal activated pyridoxal enzyme [Photobacterium marinum]|uniref:Metal activated pyridoxal enzyme n=1 Tax=Photobacterium marinum TaxID=1056511 RepID=L8J352_9GAMM|nr:MULTISPECIES: alanine racemase [Photobacterium]ELR63181.1 Metal activated pyridoxal enzyme [Photobacterium marinum]